MCRGEKANRHRQCYTILVAVLLVGGVALRLFRLGALSLWLDESFTASVSSGGLQSIWRFCLSSAGPLPLTFFFPWLAQMVAGAHTEFTVRFFDFLFGSAALPLFYLLVRRLSGSKFVSLVGLLLLSVSGVHHYYSQDARGYAGFLFFSLLAFFFLWGALVEGRRRYWLFYFLSLSVAFYFSFFAVFLIMGHFLFGLGLIRFDAQQGCPVRRLTATLVIVTLFLLLVVGLWYLLAMGRYEEIAVPRYSVTKIISFFVSAFIELSGGSLLVGVAVLLVVLIGLWVTKGTIRWVIVYPLLLFLLIFALINLNPTPPRHLHHRYLLGTLPFWLLSVALSLDALRQRVKSLGLAISVAILSVYGVVNVHAIWTNVHEEKQNWRDATRFVVDNYRPGDAIVGGRNACYVALHFYLPAGLCPSLVREALPSNALIDTLKNQGHRIWYVTAYYRSHYRWGAEPKDSLRSRRFYDWLDQHFLVAARFAGREDVTVFLSRSGHPGAENSP